MRRASSSQRWAEFMPVGRLRQSHQSHTLVQDVSSTSTGTKITVDKAVKEYIVRQ